MKLKSAKVTFTDESRYNFATAIKTGDEKIDQMLDQYVHVLNSMQVALGTNVYFMQ